MQGHCNMAPIIWICLGKAGAFPYPPRLGKSSHLGPWTHLGSQFCLMGPAVGLASFWSECGALIQTAHLHYFCLKFRTKRNVRDHLTILQVRKQSRIMWVTGSGTHSWQRWSSECVLMSPEHHRSVISAANHCGFTAVRVSASISANSYFICSPFAPLPHPLGCLTLE